MTETPARRSPQPLQPTERIAVCVICALLALRVFYLFAHAVDSDEPQNLHVIYQWWKGDLPYLDQFDNHAPLFHFLFMPFAALVGEHANVVVLSRLALVPLSFGVVGIFYLLCRRLYDRRTALWSVAVTLALADWALKSIEFRPDVLWVFLWFAALCFLVRPDSRPAPFAFLIAGLLLGASVATSVKTVFLLPALGIGWVGTRLLSRDFRKQFSASVILRCAATSLAGFAVVPCVMAAYFASRGALDEMAFCIYAINKDPFLNERSWIFFAAMPVTFVVAAWIIRRGGLGTAFRGAVFLTAAAYTLAIIGFGPFESLAKQTFLPAYPLLLAAACDVVLSLRSWRDWQVSAIGGAACIALTVATLAGSPPWHDGTATQRELLRAVLQHTAPEDCVMDLKGETIFRKRPVYLAYVGITRRGMDTGHLQAPATSSLADTATAIAIESTAGFPEEMQNFLRDNYLRTTGQELRAAGTTLKPSWNDGKWIARASVAIAGDYVVIENGKVTSEVTMAADKPRDFTLGGREQGFLFWKAAWVGGLRPARD